ncbi:MAG: hypothetical protein ACR2RV_17950, partial [Verrucomicrobiales bacterium]
KKVARKISLELPRSEIVTEELERDQSLRFARDGVSVEFGRDPRGRATVTVSESIKNHTDEELQAMGEELSNGIVRQYVYQKLTDEMRARDFVVVEEETNADQSIRLKVRHWEN